MSETINWSDAQDSRGAATREFIIAHDGTRSVTGAL